MEPKHPSRRTFLAAAAGALATTAGPLSLPSTLVAAEKPSNAMLPIVDTHQHLWDLDKFRLGWVEPGTPLARSFVTKDYLAATAGLNVVKAVYMEVDVVPEQQQAEAEHVIALSKSDEHPTVAAVISGRPAEAGFRKYASQFRDSRQVRGVRQVLHVPSTPAGLCLGKEYVASMQLLGELGKSFDLCMRPTELGDGVKLAGQCPDTTFIVDHCGNGDPKAFLSAAAAGEEKPWHGADEWKRQIHRLAGCPNVLCKISGIVVRAPKSQWKAEMLAPLVNHCLDEFGPERVLFGGDWPVCTLVASYGEWVTALKEIIAHRPLAEQRKLLHDNAVRQYQLGS